MTKKLAPRKKKLASQLSRRARFVPGTCVKLSRCAIMVSTSSSRLHDKQGAGFGLVIAAVPDRSGITYAYSVLWSVFPERARGSFKQLSHNVLDVSLTLVS